MTDEKSQESIKPQTVTIFGKEYVTVAERVKLAHHDLKEISIETEILPVEGIIVVKATVLTPKGKFTGISAANPNKAIEKQNPYEVAETSAVGRALGFAGYGLVDSIASADEIAKVEKELASEKQINFIHGLLEQKNYSEEDVRNKYGVRLNELTKDQASQIIEGLTKAPVKSTEDIDVDSIAEKI